MVYSATTTECLERLGLQPSDLERFTGLALADAHALAKQLGLVIFEAAVDGEPHFRIMLLQCSWLSVEVRAGRIERVLGLG